MTTFPSEVALRRQLATVSIDPQTLAKIERHNLPVGTVIEDPYGALLNAVEEGTNRVLVRARTASGVVSLEGVAVADLRAAIESHESPL
jgi:hypothetical protein